jgi:phosphoglycerate kinase
MRLLEQQNFKNERAVIRVDFNVPLNEELEVTDKTRIQAAKPTIEYILSKAEAVYYYPIWGVLKEGIPSCL